MTDATDRFQLPFIMAGQAQKEITHNEALTAIDALLCATAETAGDNTPPGMPADGRSWIVGTAPTGAWTNHPGALATWTGGGWRFAEAAAGMRAWVAGEQLWAEHDGAGWSLGSLRGSEVRIEGHKVVGAQAGAIAAPAGGATIDAQARGTLAAVLEALRGHGLIAP